MEKNTNKQAKDNTVKQRLQDILLSVSWRDIANTYFDRSASWLYHKLDGIDGEWWCRWIHRQGEGAASRCSCRPQRPLTPCCRQYLGRWLYYTFKTQVVRAYGCALPRDFKVSGLFCWQLPTAYFYGQQPFINFAFVKTTNI